MLEYLIKKWYKGFVIVYHCRERKGEKGSPIGDNMRGLRSGQTRMI